MTQRLMGTEGGAASLSGWREGRATGGAEEKSCSRL